MSMMFHLKAVCSCCWLAVISEQEFYGSRTSSAHELCPRRISGDGNNVIVAETYHSSTYSAQNNSAGTDHGAHAKLTYMSSLSAPDVHQVTHLVHVFFVKVNRLATLLENLEKSGN